jgi:hypothetical protein
MEKETSILKRQRRSIEVLNNFQASFHRRSHVTLLHPNNFLYYNQIATHICVSFFSIGGEIVKIYLDEQCDFGKSYTLLFKDSLKIHQTLDSLLFSIYKPSNYFFFL